MPVQQTTATESPPAPPALHAAIDHAALPGQKVLAPSSAGNVRQATGRRIILYANTDWYLYNFRLALLEALTARGHEVIVMSPPGPYGEKLEGLGFRWIRMPMRRTSLNPLTELPLVAKIAGIYRRERPDVVHHFTIKCVVYGSLAARFAGVRRRINAVAGLGTVYSGRGFRNALLRPLVSLLLRASLAGRGSRLILQNPDDWRLFTDNKLVRPERAHLIRGSGVDGSRFRPRPPAAGHVPCRVLFAARLLWSKGIEQFVAAAGRLASPGRCEFLVAGRPDRGNPDAVDADWLAAREREGKVRLLGHVGDMARLLGMSDIVVLPSTYGEGVPRILVEAAAAGLPLVAFDVAGSREIVLDGENGFLVPAGDQDRLESALETLLDSARLRARFGAASRRHFESEYDVATVIARTVEVYGIE